MITFNPKLSQAFSVYAILVFDLYPSKHNISTLKCQCSVFDKVYFLCTGYNDVFFFPNFLEQDLSLRNLDYFLAFERGFLRFKVYTNLTL